MVVTWIVYTLIVSGLVAGAAVLLETGQVERGRPLRGAWLAGILAAPLVILLSAAGLRPGGWTAPWLTSSPLPAGGGGASEVGWGAVLPVMGAGASEGWEAGAMLDPWAPWLLAAWGVLSLLLLGRWWIRHRALRQGLAGHPRLDLGGRPVVVTERLGPGLLGVFRPETLLPRWCLELPSEDRELVLAHEEEHRRRGDNVILAAATLVRMLIPWNVPLWWMERRLRVAVELDCDARVAARHPGHRRRYAELLLHTASRRPHRWAAAPLALLAEPSVPLHRRILMLTRIHPRPVSRLRLSALGLGALAFVGLAILLPGPGLDTLAADAQPAPPAAVVADTPTTRAALQEGPTFTPFTVMPEVRNRTQVAAALEREYPSVLREAGIEGTVIVYLFVDVEGKVQQARVFQSSGQLALDEAGLRVAREFDFSPALNRTTPVPVWIQLPIAFRAGASEAVERSGGARSTPPAPTASPPSPPAAPRTAEPPPAAAPPPSEPPETGEISQGAVPPQAAPVFTPFTVAPAVRNRAEVSAALLEEYPPLLREAGVRGSVLVHFHIDAEGSVQEARVSESSGHPALDAAALRVARVFDFSPAMNRDQRVPVWIQVPITFTTVR